MTAIATSGARPLLVAAHIGPAVAVTLIATLLAVADELAVPAVLAVTGVVLTGQLTIGWGNDLLDAARDRAVGRSDKPLATGELQQRTVRVALSLAAGGCLLLSLALPWPSAVAHLGLVVAAGHAYNAGLKATLLSWLPYAVAFGSLPAVVALAGDPPRWPAWWLAVAAGTLGVAAHLLNVLPDLADDEATGVRGLPHRLGATTSRVLATVLLLVATVTAVFGPGLGGAWRWGGLTVVAGLAVVALTGRGRRPFQAAVAIALVDVVLLVAAGSVPA